MVINDLLQAHTCGSQAQRHIQSIPDHLLRTKGKCQGFHRLAGGGVLYESTIGRKGSNRVNIAIVQKLVKHFLKSP